MPSRKVPTSIQHQPRGRLQPSDWVWAGFRALVQGGPQALRVEPIARELGTTKGSFYWHFADLAALRTAMLEAWEQVATADITAAVQQSGLPAYEQLLLLVEKVSAPPDAEAGGNAVEPAIRDWGRTDPIARQVLERVDCQRLTDLRDFFGATGLVPTAAAQAAAVFYATVIGLESLRLTAGMSMREPLRAVAERLLAPR
ncbi:MAG: TetR/AcrR family transcriptional regulator [Rhodoferax sp.]|nr:TetR/AcrR family transcriptional regulator [Rhodoferax sp.]